MMNYTKPLTLIFVRIGPSPTPPGVETQTFRH